MTSQGENRFVPITIGDQFAQKTIIVTDDAQVGYLKMMTPFDLDQVVRCGPDSSRVSV